MPPQQKFDMEKVCRVLNNFAPAYEYSNDCPRKRAVAGFKIVRRRTFAMSEFLFSAWRNEGSGSLAALREIFQMLIKALGPVIDVLRPLWDRLVAFLRSAKEQLADQDEAEQDRATWGRPELGWDS